MPEEMTETDEQRDAAVNAALDRILDGADGEPTQPEPSSEPSDDATDSGTAPAEESTGDGDEGATDGLDPDLRRALRRDGVPHAVIEATDPATLREWAEAAKKRQADVDSYSERMKALKAKVATDGDADGGNRPDDADDGGAGDEGTDPDSGDSVGSDDLAEQVEALRAEVEASKRAASTGQEAAEVAWAVADLAMRRPGLSSEQVQEVMDEARRLAATRPGAFGSYSEMLTEAADIALGPPPSSRNGPTPPGQPMQRSLSPDEVEDAVLDAILDGKDGQQALRSVTL